MDKPNAAYAGSDPYIFVSYSHADADRVYPHIRRLQDDGFHIWYDEGIGAGLSWRDEVALSITECSLYVMFLTNNSAQSEVCREELFFALSRERKVLVVYLEDCLLSPGMELGLSDKQALMAQQLEPAEYWRKLVQALKAYHLDDDDDSDAGSHLLSKKGIAVLPLTILGDDPEAMYLSEGIAEELLTGMANVEGLRVVSGFAFKNQNLDIRNIGIRFKVDSVLGGSIQRSGNRIRINMRLTSTAGGETLWAYRFEFSMTDIFDVQDQVAKGVLDALRLQDAENSAGLKFGTNSVEAYEHYLLGLFAKRKYERQAFGQAIDHFTRATRIDPEFSRAWYMLGLCYWELTVFQDDKTALVEKAEQAFEKARNQSYRPEIPWVQIERKIHPELRPDQRKLALEALDLLDQRSADWQRFELVQVGRCLGAAGLYQGAFDFLTEYLERVPLPVREVHEIRLEVDGLLPVLGRFNEAIMRTDDYLVEDPDDYPARLQRCMLYSRTGQYGKARADLDHLKQSAFYPFATFYDLFWRDQIADAEALSAKILADDNVQLRFKWRCCAMFGQIERAVGFMKQSAARGAPLFNIRVLLADSVPESRLREIESSDVFQQFLLDQGVSEDWPVELAGIVNAREQLTNIRVEAPAR